MRARHQERLLLRSVTAGVEQWRAKNSLGLSWGKVARAIPASIRAIRRLAQCRHSFSNNKIGHGLRDVLDLPCPAVTHTIKVLVEESLRSTSHTGMARLRSIGAAHILTAR